MPPQLFTARLSERRQLTSKFIFLHFELVSPNRIQFQSGQYVLLTVPTTPQKKSYSLVSSPQVEHAIDLLVDLAPNGLGTQYLNALQPGQEIQFMAPIGMFTLAPPATESSVVMIATGSGIAPFRSMVDDLLIQNGDQRPITLYWGLRYAEDQFWYDDFAQYSEQHPNFSFHPVLSKPPTTWPLCTGHVTDCLRVHELPAGAGYYLCGNSAMIREVSEVLLQRGVPQDKIHHEKFY